MTTSGAEKAVVRRRPKDRKAQIARAAAEAFSAQGYHAVRMESIAGKVGISGAALYRHYASKYDLFRDAVLALGQQLVEGTAFIDAEADDADPAALLDRAAQALIDVTLANRDSGGLYRWHARYLRGADETLLLDQLRVVNHRIQRPLLAIRPQLTAAERWMLSSGLLSIVGSIVNHRVRMPANDIRTVLRGAGAALLAGKLLQPQEATTSPVARRIFAADAGAYEALLHASMVLFHERGYPETSMAQIGTAVGIPVSGIYRYFSGKGEILTTGLRRAADRVSSELTAVLGDVADPRQALTLLVEAYVATSFTNPELATVYYTERVNLPPPDQMMLRNVQRSTIDSWVRLLVSVRDDLTIAAARILVHAAMGLVVDVAPVARYEKAGDQSAYPQACTRRLMELTLFGS